MGWFLYYTVNVRSVRVDTGPGDEERWTLRHTGRSSECPTNYADLVVDDTVNSIISINHLENNACDLSFWLDGESTKICNGVTLPARTNYSSATMVDFEFLANKNCGILALLDALDDEHEFVITSTAFARFHGSNIDLNIAVKSKYEGYTATWPEGSAVTIEQDFTKIKVSVSNPPTLSPGFSESGYTTTYTYNVYKAIAGVRTLLGTMNSQTGYFDLGSSDYEQLVFIFVTCTVHFGRAGTVTTTDELDDAIRVSTPGITWGQDAALLFTTNEPDAYNPESTYAVGDQVKYLGKVYECTTVIASPESWNASHWAINSSFVLQATLTVQGSAVLIGGTGDPLYKLSNETGSVDISSYDTPKTWTFDLTNPYVVTTYAVTASITKYNVTYYTSTDIRVTSNLFPPAAAYFDGQDWVPCDVFYWDGTNWVQCEVNYWDGHNWIPCEG